MKKMTYVDVHHTELSDAEIQAIIRNDDREQLVTLPMKLGFCHENWRFVQDICVKLSEHPDESIRGNSFRGLQYVAMNHRKLEKNIVKPILLRGCKDESDWVRGCAEDAIKDINRFMKWRIGTASATKAREKRFFDSEQKKKGQDTNF